MVRSGVRVQSLPPAAIAPGRVHGPPSRRGPGPLAAAGTASTGALQRRRHPAQRRASPRRPSCVATRAGPPGGLAAALLERPAHSRGDLLARERPGWAAPAVAPSPAPPSSALEAANSVCRRPRWRRGCGVARFPPCCRLCPLREGCGLARSCRSLGQRMAPRPAAAYARVNVKIIQARRGASALGPCLVVVVCKVDRLGRARGRAKSAAARRRHGRPGDDPQPPRRLHVRPLCRRRRSQRALARHEVAKRRPNAGQPLLPRVGQGSCRCR